jgi:hypothetical protein
MDPLHIISTVNVNISFRRKNLSPNATGENVTNKVQKLRNEPVYKTFSQVVVIVGFNVESSSKYTN